MNFNIKKQNVLICHEKHTNTQNTAVSPVRDNLINLDEHSIVKAYLTDMTKPSDVPYSEYLHIVHDLNGLNNIEDRVKDHGSILVYFPP